jgi:hypothetical protein
MATLLMPATYAYIKAIDVSSIVERASICKSRNITDALEIRAVPIYRT